jgi:hypothetical protein
MGLNLDVDVPAAPSAAEVVTAAAALRQRMEELTPTGLCAVCSCSCPPSVLRKLPYADVPRSELLRADGPKTSECPRDAKTVTALPDGRVYCLQPAAVTDAAVVICSECLSSLQGGKIPPHSLVRVDTGHKPDGLEWPTLLEQLCIGWLRPHRLTVVCRPQLPNAQPWRDWSGQQPHHVGLVGHVTAHANPQPQQMATMLPLPFEQLSDFVKVILLTPASDLQEAKRRAAHCPALRIRGRVVAGWVRHISAASSSSGMDGALLRAYESIDGIPDSLLTAHNVVYAPTSDDVNALQRAYVSTHEGYADSL